VGTAPESTQNFSFSDTPTVQDKNLSRKQHTILNHQMKKYLQALTSGREKDSEQEIVDDTRNILYTLATTVFHSPQLLLSNRDNKINNNDSLVPTNPIVLLCNKALHAFPWELIFGETLFRSFCLVDIINRRKRKIEFSKENREISPQYFTCFSSQEDRTVRGDTHQRRNVIIDDLFYKLNHQSTFEYFGEYQIATVPMHSPLIRYGKSPNHYKRKYKYISFLDVADFESQPSKIISILDQRANEHPNRFLPVFLLTFTDLLEMSDTVLCLLSYYNCTLLFVPGGKIKQVVATLMRKHEKYKWNDPYKLLVSTIVELEKELCIPIAKFRPPLV